MKMTRIVFPHFGEIIIVGEMSKNDKIKVKAILVTMSTDEYAGYPKSFSFFGWSYTGKSPYIHNWNLAG